MKKFVRVMCLLLAITALVAVSAYASEQSERASLYFSAYRAYCYAASSTKIEVNFAVIGAGIMEELGASQILVQQSSDRTNWTTVKTFSRDNYSDMIATNRGTHGATLSCDVAAGYYYRAYVTFYAKNSSGYGKKYYYTEII